MNSQPNAIADTADFEFAALAEAKNYRAALLRDFRDYLCGNVLEVGCGVGQMTEELLRQPAVKQLVSVEPDASFCEKVRAKLPQHTLVQGTVADLNIDRPWNAIVSINVLEHIEHDTDELRSYYQLLRPAGGALCLFVPARPEIYAPIDRDFGHFRRYKRAELDSKLTSAGFQIKRIRYYNLIGYFLWYLNFRLLRKRSFDAPAVRAFDRAAFPLIHACETHLFAPPIGQSLMAIAIAR